MPDEQNAELVEEGSGGKGGIVVILATAVVCLGLGAGGAYFVFQPNSVDSAPADAAAGSAEQKQAEVDDFQKRVHALEPFVVNVTGDGYARFLKVKVELETSRADMREEIVDHLPQIRDSIIVLLSSKRLSDLTDFEGKALLKDDIRLRVNDVLKRGEVRSVLFTEFVIQ